MGASIVITALVRDTVPKRKDAAPQQTGLWCHSCSVAITGYQNHTPFAPSLLTSPLWQRWELLHRDVPVALEKHTGWQQSGQVTVAIELKAHCTLEVLPFRHGPVQAVA